MPERFLISDDGDIVGELKPPFQLLLQATGTADENGTVRIEANNKEPRGPKRPRGLSKHELVEPAGLEPATFWLPARRSPS